MRSILFAAVDRDYRTCARGHRPGNKTSCPHAYGDTEFRLGPDDVIEVSVYQDKELDRTVPVRPDGKISLPLIGEMTASGKTATDLQKEIALRLKQFVADPTVTVVVKEVNSPKVSVIGEVKSPNMYKIKDRATLLDAIALAGGLTEYSQEESRGFTHRAERRQSTHRVEITIKSRASGRIRSMSFHTTQSTFFSFSRNVQGEYEKPFARSLSVVSSGAIRPTGADRPERILIHRTDGDFRHVRPQFSG